MPKETKNANHYSRLHLGLGVVIYSALLGVVVALIADCYEIGFKYLAIFWHEENNLLHYVPTWLLYGAGPFIAGPILYFIISRIPEKRAHNPADLITGIHIDNGRINALAALLTAMASAISIAFGFSVGYYAPTVQLGAGMGAIFHRLKWIRPAHAYISVGAGAAAAIAAIFHSPIGAVVFVHEVLFRFFSVRAFAPVTIAAVTAYVVSSELFDKVMFLEVAAHYRPDSPTYLVAALAGVLAAFVGMMMLRTILRLQQFNHQRQHSMSMQFFIASAVTALLIVAVPQVAGSSLQAMQGVLSGTQFSILMLLVIFVAKFLATSTAFGFGIPGGIFGPTLFIGATLGGVVADCMVLIAPSMASAHQIIIITTMAAMISAVLGSPIAMILIIVELTGDFHIISVVMLAVVMANVTAYRFMGTSSFFDIQLKSRGFDFDAGRDQLYAEHHGITDLISDSYVAIDENMTLAEVEHALIEAGKTAAYVVDEDGNMGGRVSLVDVEMAHKKGGEQQTLQAVIETDPPVLYRNTSLWQAIQLMSHSNNRCLAVIDGESNPKLLGVVYTQPLMTRYFAQLRSLRAEENVS
ncbi:MAG: hypothetical protein CR974_00900 [Gammaproteobacteria bacterium]|nr:MAG: hypothetical protein CR974_00900 [Gammaproteobacteria bacterium]